MLFLSYAEEDREVAAEIARRLEDADFEVFRWEDPKKRGRQFIQQIEDEIRNSTAFLALISPSFLASGWCRRERDMALRREQALQADDPHRNFIHVLQVVTTDSAAAGFLGNYDWLDMIDPGSRDIAISELAARLGSLDQPGEVDAQAEDGQPREVHNGGSEPASRGQMTPTFRNRDNELERVLRGLTNPSGPHFWLVIAPPQLGKSWFLNQVSEDMVQVGPVPWVVRRVDLREQSAEVRSNPGALLALLFARESPVTIEPITLRRIAQDISRNMRPHLCLLDGADMLDRSVTETVRSCLGQVHRLVKEQGRIDVRLALIVASRHEDGWRGVTPAPRLSQLTLTEFGSDIVEQALRDLAEAMGQNISEKEYAYYGPLVHRLTEGLPALLTRFLEWVNEEQWYGLEDLETRELFEQFADPYIKTALFALDSLFPKGLVDGDASVTVLSEAFRVLAPYRLFTQSHLRYQLETDTAFRGALNGQKWHLEHLWKAVSGTALLSRLLDEPWREIHPAIRRLIYRHYYSSDELQAEVHNKARKFVEVWGDRQSGKEQVIGLVECLWHEAVVLRLLNVTEMERSLSDSARTLSRAVRPSNAFTEEELREYAVERMQVDEELEETVSVVGGLFNRLIEIVRSPM